MNKKCRFCQSEMIIYLDKFVNSNNNNFGKYFVCNNCPIEVIIHKDNGGCWINYNLNFNNEHYFVYINFEYNETHINCLTLEKKIEPIKIIKNFSDINPINFHNKINMLLTFA